MSASCWPNKNQELLVRACLMRGPEALVAWQQWQAVFEAGPLDKGSHRLLPLLYRNLQNQNVSGAWMARLKEEYFHTWSQNQFSLREIAKLVTALNESGIRNMLLKGSALAVLYYEDVGLRPMKDIDVLVPPDSVKQSMRLLRKLGWEPRYAAPEALIPFEQAAEFLGPNNQFVDLHWRLLWEGRQDLTDDRFWKSSIPMELGGLSTTTLNPADQLLHVCVHGAKWNDTSPLRWIADAMMIIRSRNLSIDWPRVVHEARERQLTLPMRETLKYLNQLLDANIPTEVLTNLEGTRTTRLERWTYRTRSGANDRLKMLTVVCHWMNSLWLNCEGSATQRLGQFSQYLQTLWSVSSAWMIPFYLVVKPIKRVYYTIKFASEN